MTTEFDALLDASSLGTPGAKALRALTPREVVERIRAGTYPSPERTATVRTEEEEVALDEIDGEISEGNQ